MSVSQNTLCLNMIVKNESAVIEKCLELMISQGIDTYVIVDTGSTDGTQKIIKDFFNKAGIEGVLVEHDFKSCKCHPDPKYKKADYFDFGLNRTYAIQQAAIRSKTSDYLFVMDADDSIVGEIHAKTLINSYKKYEFDTFRLILGSDTFTYTRPLIFRNDKRKPFVFNGPIHEYLTPLDKNEPKKNKLVDGNYRIVSNRLGERNRTTEKYKKDALVFESVLKDMKPGDENYNRYLYYCAQSWKDYSTETSIPREDAIEAVRNAIKWYTKRIKMSEDNRNDALIASSFLSASDKKKVYNEFTDEVFVSHKDMAILSFSNGMMTEPEFIKACMDAYAVAPNRCETLLILSKLFIKNDKVKQAIAVLETAIQIPYSGDSLFCTMTDYTLEVPVILSRCYIKERVKLEDAKRILCGVLEDEKNEAFFKGNLGAKNSIIENVSMCEKLLASASVYILVSRRKDENSPELADFIRNISTVSLAKSVTVVTSYKNPSLGSPAKTIEMPPGGGVDGGVDDGAILIFFNALSASDDMNFFTKHHKKFLYTTSNDKNSITSVALDDVMEFAISGYDTLKSVASRVYDLDGIIFSHNDNGLIKIPFIMNYDSFFQNLEKISFHEFGKNNQIHALPAPYPFVLEEEGDAAAATAEDSGPDYSGTRQFKFTLPPAYSFKNADERYAFIKGYIINTKENSILDRKMVEILKETGKVDELDEFLKDRCERPEITRDPINLFFMAEARRERGGCISSGESREWFIILTEILRNNVFYNRELPRTIEWCRKVRASMFFCRQDEPVVCPPLATTYPKIMCSVLTTKERLVGFLEKRAFEPLLQCSNIFSFVCFIIGDNSSVVPSFFEKVVNLEKANDFSKNMNLMFDTATEGGFEYMVDLKDNFIFNEIDLVPCILDSVEILNTNDGISQIALLADGGHRRRRTTVFQSEKIRFDETAESGFKASVPSVINVKRVLERFGHLYATKNEPDLGTIGLVKSVVYAGVVDAQKIMPGIDEVCCGTGVCSEKYIVVTQRKKSEEFLAFKENCYQNGVDIRVEVPVFRSIIAGTEVLPFKAWTSEFKTRYINSIEYKSGEEELVVISPRRGEEFRLDIEDELNDYGVKSFLPERDVYGYDIRFCPEAAGDIKRLKQICSELNGNAFNSLGYIKKININSAKIGNLPGCKNFHDGLYII